jgi:plasmid stability protein
MKNLTISLDDEMHHRSRVKAARAGMSMSRYIATLVERDTAAASPDADEETRQRLEALQRVFDAPKLDVSESGRMPSAEERNARR